MPKFDFSGWVTRNNILCSDGRTIRRNAFRDNDGMTVPLVWNHDHNSPENVLGNITLENREEGVYGYGKFNDTEAGQNAKMLVQHGDIDKLSIYANQLKQNGGNVMHGLIREVSLVLAGANKGAFIDNIMAHGEMHDDEAIIFCVDDGDYLCHAEDELPEYEETIGDIFDTMNDKQQLAVCEMIKMLSNKNSLAHGDEDDYDEEEVEEMASYEEILDTLDEDQVEAVNALIEEVAGNVADEVADAYESAYEDEDDEYYEDEDFDDEDYDDEGEYEEMKHNIFDNEWDDGTVLSHSDMADILQDGEAMGSLKASVLAHTDNYGIQQLPSTFSDTTYGIDALFPDYRELNTPPEFLKRDTGWVKTVMNGVHHTPFSRIKTTFADITPDEARARGYMKGNLKKEEVFTLLKRTTDPQTVYKKQKLDRDDIIDITDFDVVAWIKSEMRMMLDEEIARAILIGDGRLAASDDKIQENHVRPIWTDHPLYTINTRIDVRGLTPPQKAKAFITACIKARKDYKGSGNPVLFTTEEFLTEMLLLEDNIGRTLYNSVDQLATKLRVSRIVTVELMENKTRTVSDVVYTLGGIIVNLNDYNVGADKGGSINLFDDFDIDYNQYKYLIETRISGALIKPKSAIAVEFFTSEDEQQQEEEQQQGEG